MNKTKQNKWWKYLTVSLIGILLFVIFIPSCTYLSSTNFNVLVREDKSEAIADEKSFAEVIANLPTAEQIQAMPLAAHPRLLASGARFTEIKELIKTDKTMRKWYEKIKRQGDRFLEDELPVYGLPDGKRLFRNNRDLERRVTTLAFLYKIERQPLYFKRVWQDLAAIANFTNWNPKQFLDPARMSYIAAIGYDWLYEDLNPEQRLMLRSAIVNKALKPALEDYRTSERWTTVEHNWNQVCNGGIGIASLAVMDEYPDLASQTLSAALHRLPKAMQHYAPDGAWDEGINYWDFGTTYNVLILDALASALGDDFGLSQISGFKETGLFPIYMSGAFGQAFNFADGTEYKVRASELFWMSDKFKIASYADFQQEVAIPLPLDLIWYNPNWKYLNAEELPLDRYFRGTEVVSMRSEWDNPQGIFVGFKAGNNDTSHGNLDLGTFVIDALGVRWAVELGKDNYSLPGYFDREKKRWNYYKTRAEGQNTLVINPNFAPDQNPHAIAKIDRFKSEPDRVYAVSNLTSAYNNVRKVERSVALLARRQQILIKDDIQADSPLDMWWFMHTEADIRIGDQGKTAMLEQDGSRLWVKLLNPKLRYRFTIMDAKPLPSSPNPKDQDNNSAIKKLAICLKGITNEQLAILFVPLDVGENPPKDISAANSF